MTALVALALAALPLSIGESPADAPAPLPPLPSARQLARQEMEICAFVHFGMNTFTDREWGDGHENERLFDPSELDCRQWARTFQAAGVKGIVLTCKHHDGFCLWPSKYTEHSVKNSPWKGGQGDVVRDLSDACHEFGLKFGVYLSPWDRNAGSYGQGRAYDEFYAHQLSELLTSYGDIFEVWWDGANGEGPNGKRQTYDWKLYTEIVRRLQPNAVIFSDGGPDLRWAGNENGFAGETNWSMFSNEKIVPGTSGIESILSTGQIDGSNWVPSECDVSIRTGWFFHASESSTLKPLDTLLAIQQGSVGRNASLLLNVPADKRGLIPDADVQRLYELGRLIDRIYAEDLARGRKVSADHAREGFGAERAVDGDPATYFATEDDARAATLTLEDLGGRRHVSRVVLREPIALGQRVESFRVEALPTDESGEWRVIAEGTTIGRKRILQFSPVECTKLRLVVTRARACPLIASFEAYAATPTLQFTSQERSFLGGFDVELVCDLPDAVIYYTLDGTPPSEHSARYTGPIHIESTSTVSAVAFANGSASLANAVATFRRFDLTSLLPRIDRPRTLERGVHVRCYEARITTLDSLLALQPVRTLNARRVDLGLRTRDEHCALMFEGYLAAPKDGAYTFTTTSDDGSCLYIDGERIVDNDGLHGTRERSGSIGLRAGWHRVRIEWFNATGERVLELAWAGPGFSRQRMGEDLIYR